MYMMCVKYLMDILYLGRAGFHQNFHRGPHVFDVEEANILYVAVTRAKCSLIFTSTLAKIMKDAKVVGSL